MKEKAEQDLWVFLQRKQGRVTRQRRMILDEILRGKPHRSVEELHRRLRARKVRVSVSTLYRTIRLLDSAGLAANLSLPGAGVRLEPSAEAGHHDHLICTVCGRIDEFCDPEIERLQEKTVRARGYRPLRHRLQIFGVCPTCRKRKRSR